LLCFDLVCGWEPPEGRAPTLTVSLLVLIHPLLLLLLLLLLLHLFAGVVGIPVAAFLIVYCGMPADIMPSPAVNSSTLMFLCCQRQDRPLYNAVHALWHLVSGVGPLASVWLFHRLALSNGDLTYVMGLPPARSLDPWHTLPLVPTAALLAGVAVNVAGNLAGVMPLD